MASSQQLKSRIGQLRQEIRDLEAQLIEAHLREVGLEIGDVLVRQYIDNKRACHNTHDVGTVCGWVGWPVVRLHKKDGTVGKSERHFYHWKKTEPQQAS